MDLFVGRQVGPYELHERLGAGGMGVVYRATHRRLRQPRAVKVLPANLAANRTFVERFEREARLAAELEHPNIVRVHDVGDHDGTHYLAMELLAGRSLGQLIREEAPVPLGRAVALLRQLAAALDFAHGRGVAHRDVKPGNVFVAADDHLTLVDFGIARAAEEARLTGTGAIVGTAEYLAPEVVLGAEHGPGSDLYALGIVAYELITGRVPFTGPSSHPIMYAQVNRPPPRPRSFRSDLSPVVEGLLLRQLAKTPEHRFPTATAFVDALATEVGAQQRAQPPIRTPDSDWHLVEDRPDPERTDTEPAAGEHGRAARDPTRPRVVPRPPVVPRGRVDESRTHVLPTGEARHVSRRRLLLAVVGLTVGGGGLAYALPGREPAATPGPAPGDTPPPAVAGTASVLRPTISPGVAAEAVARPPGSPSPAQTGAAGERILAGHTGDVRAVAWSPDGQLVASGSEDFTARLWRVGDGTPAQTLIGHANYVMAVAFSPDGQLLATGSLDKTARLWKVADGSLVRTLSGHADAIWGVAFSPDGQSLVSCAAAPDATVRLWRIADGSEVRMMRGHHGTITCVAFSPGGKVIASGAEDKTIRFWSPDDGKEISLLSGHDGTVFSLAFSPDAQLLASGAGDRTARLWRVGDGSTVRAIRPTMDLVHGVAYSPEGRVLACSSGSEPNMQLWNVPDGTARRTLAGHEQGVYSVRFSPDGRSLASGSRDKTVRIWQL
ncbi:MAG: protein kinase [Chloroflexota bacterium]